MNISANRVFTVEFSDGEADGLRTEFFRLVETVADMNGRDFDTESNFYPLLDQLTAGFQDAE